MTNYEKHLLHLAVALGFAAISDLSDQLLIALLLAVLSAWHLALSTYYTVKYARE